MMILKRPMLIHKFLLRVLLLTLLITSLSACQFSTSSYEPLSEEKITEIRAAWEVAPVPPLGNCDYHYLLDFTSSENYYGTRGDCIALFHGWREDTDVDTATYIPVADLCIHSEFSAKIIIYRNGEFAYITDAYENGWLTKEQVASIAEHHKTTSNYCSCYDDSEKNSSID